VRRASLVVAIGLVASGCITDHVIELELRPPRAPDGGPDVPSEVVSYEVRLYRLAVGEHCPDAATAASASAFGELGQAQSFERDVGMGDAIGEIPSGHYAVAGLARDSGCAVRLYGCTELDVGVAAPMTVVVELAAASVEGCGACRTCASGACDPIAEICR
jgi:hypothetical protein